MEIKKRVIAGLTPKNTELIKPNLYIQQTHGESIFSRLDKIVKGHREHIRFDKYRQITPVAWDGKIINWIVLFLGARPVWSTLTFLVILLMCFGYVNDGKVKDNFYSQIIYNQTYKEMVCKQNLEGNLTQVFSFNITKFCHSEINLNLTGTVQVNISALNWSLK
jgi:hypothetical protein